ncbi:MAG: hypothetical protein HQL53_06185 [Magnetococcales bacterium]|nr:hypothetical protein [Magnetococcales bacterium]
MSTPTSSLLFQAANDEPITLVDDARCVLEAVNAMVCGRNDLDGFGPEAVAGVSVILGGVSNALERASGQMWEESRTVKSAAPPLSRLRIPHDDEMKARIREMIIKVSRPAGQAQQGETSPNGKA